MRLLDAFKRNISKNNLFTPKDRLLLAVSGGVDSVVLCELCRQAGYDFIIAHCNFRLRGKESERDKEFVKNLNSKYDVEVLEKEFDTEKYAAEKKLSTQEAARELRYKWFFELTESPSVPIAIGIGPRTPDFILTAHHSDDNIETLLMNFFRGTGLHGLTGIPAINNRIRRPLLDFTKQELLDFAKEHKLDYVEDSSNESSKYTRNFFRNELLPAIAKVYPDVNNNLQDNIKRFSSIEKLYRVGVDELKKKLCKQKGEELHIPVLQLMKFNNRALIYEIISPFGFTEGQVDELIKLAGSDSGKYLQTPANDFRVFRHRHWFIIAPVNSITRENILIEQGSGILDFGIGKLKIESFSDLSSYNHSNLVQSGNNTASFDSKEIKFPLLLRKWKQGDYFYPLGMKKKKKKLSRFFIDNKLSATEKKKVWVLESENRILWVVGHRIDERFKVTDKTKDLLRLSFTGH